MPPEARDSQAGALKLLLGFLPAPHVTEKLSLLCVSVLLAPRFLTLRRRFDEKCDFQKSRLRAPGPLYHSTSDNKK